MLIHTFFWSLVAVIQNRPAKVLLASTLDDIHGFLMNGLLMVDVKSFPGSILLDQAQQTIDLIIQGFNIVHLSLESLHPGVFPPTIVMTDLRGGMS